MLPCVIRAISLFFFFSFFLAGVVYLCQWQSCLSSLYVWEEQLLSRFWDVQTGFGELQMGTRRSTTNVGELSPVPHGKYATVYRISARRGYLDLTRGNQQRHSINLFCWAQDRRGNADTSLTCSCRDLYNCPSAGTIKRFVIFFYPADYFSRIQMEIRLQNSTR